MQCCVFKLSMQVLTNFFIGKTIMFQQGQVKYFSSSFVFMLLNFIIFSSAQVLATSGSSDNVMQTSLCSLEALVMSIMTPISIIGVIAVSVGFFFGKVRMETAVVVAVAIIIINAAPTLVQQIGTYTGSTPSACEDTAGS